MMVLRRFAITACIWALFATIGRAQSSIEWQYGSFADVGYLYDFNHPSNHAFRNRGTAWHVDKLDLNMAGVSLKKKITEQSRWGEEFLVQAGKDAEVFFAPAG